ncbi:uncharacterized protein LOC124275462 isoform X3 [Haliotis rubra]|uniref:uncharacterized protein LOC124275462 isoform X3 n=1 Tax=Haliotis rubra TaxID=36100 RepID=UPI001EE6044A|nr:uncharacterized protein LOC124275462 isoform X3 [Haliotis rubra]
MTNTTMTEMGHHILTGVGMKLTDHQININMEMGEIGHLIDISVGMGKIGHLIDISVGMELIEHQTQINVVMGQIDHHAHIHVGMGRIGLHMLVNVGMRPISRQKNIVARNAAVIGCPLLGDIPQSPDLTPPAPLVVVTPLLNAQREISSIGPILDLLIGIMVNMMIGNGRTVMIGKTLIGMMIPAKGTMTVTILMISVIIATIMITAMTIAMTTTMIQTQAMTQQEIGLTVNPPDHRRNHGYKKDGGGETYRRLSPDPESSVHSYPVLPPINDTPPRSAERGPGKQGENKDRSSDPRSATYTTNTNTDSGIADSGVSPEDQYNRGRDNYEDELARKRRDLGNRLANDKFDAYDDDAFRFEDMEDRDQIDRDRWERDREYRRRWIEEERRRREDELEARKKRQEAGEEDDDDDDRKKMKRSESEEELARYPSPPELRMDSPRDTESARQRTRQERDRLMHELENAREGRKHTEKEREELVKKAKMLQNKTQNRRNHARDIWKKRYFEEKKKTAPLEEQTNRLKHELDSIHRKLMSALEGPKEKNIRLGEPKPSLKNNYIILCTKLQHEIEDLRRRVENAKMKLTAEMKLRNQAEAELRALRAELTQKKINLTLTRNQHLAALNPSGEVPSSPRSVIAPQS